MLRASMRSAIKKYKIKIALKVISGEISSSTFESELDAIKNVLEYIDNSNHHKMMRKELTMNIFPFGNDGTDPSMIIKLVCFHLKIMSILYQRSFILLNNLSLIIQIDLTRFLVNHTIESARTWY